MKTEMDAADQAGGGYVDADIEARVPMGRFATPDDIAEAIAFLADPVRSGFVNGHALSVDGGWAATAAGTRYACASAPEPPLPECPAACSGRGDTAGSSCLVVRSLTVPMKSSARLPAICSNCTSPS